MARQRLARTGRQLLTAAATADVIKVGRSSYALLTLTKLSGKRSNTWRQGRDRSAAITAAAPRRGRERIGSPLCVPNWQQLFDPAFAVLDQIPNRDRPIGRRDPIT